MTDVRVAPWESGSFPEPPTELLEGMQARRPGGELIAIDRVLLRSVPLATGWNGLLGRVRADFELELQYREMIMMRVAALNGADFEWGVHYPAYLQAGGTDEKCDALREPGTANGVFDGSERALLELTDQSTRRVTVDVEVIEDVKRIFGETKTVEAVATVAAYNMVSRFLVALAI